MTDQRLENALEFANYRATLANQKAKLKDRCEAQLNYAYNGGIFHISESLISFVDSFYRQGKKSMIMLDSNKTPVDIEDVQEFYNQITTRWFESVNEYHRQNKRKVHTLID